ncbi:hypothetical protein OUZ56_028123 [Daphnia magna]|uniref:Uncharacterized protein n=1 Tax=Daphnia magna TaxID=35525 RepID=A0ABR0B2X2_9CRUS|nr:hypothetical protein OUZ56_028123 [Daphnia magna]
MGGLGCMDPRAFRTGPKDGRMGPMGDRRSILHMDVHLRQLHNVAGICHIVVHQDHSVEHSNRNCMPAFPNSRICRSGTDKDDEASYLNVNRQLCVFYKRCYLGDSEFIQDPDSLVAVTNVRGITSRINGNCVIIINRLPENNNVQDSGWGEIKASTAN